MKRRKGSRSLVRSVRWSNEEWAAVCRGAARQGVRPARYIRTAVLGGSNRPLRVPRTARMRVQGRRSVRRAVRFHPDEFSSVKRAAATLGMPPNRFVREAALGYRISSRADDELIYQLAKIGNNLNQLTRYAHTTHRLDAERLDGLAGKLSDVLERLV